VNPQHVKLWITYWWRRWRQQNRVDWLARRVDVLTYEKGMLQTRLNLTGKKLIETKEKLGQKFPEGYK